MLSTKKLLTAGLAAATLLGTLSVATESSAQRRGYHRGGDGAVVAGITGLALGAAIASGDRGYYYGPRYAYGPGYYYGAPYYAGYHRTCYYWHHDRWGRAYRVAGWC